MIASCRVTPAKSRSGRQNYSIWSDKWNRLEPSWWSSESRGRQLRWLLRNWSDRRFSWMKPTAVCTVRSSNWKGNVLWLLRWDSVVQRWSDYNTNVLWYDYDYFERAWIRVQVRVLRKQMYSSTITLECIQVRVRLHLNIIMITFRITLMNILFITWRRLYGIPRCHSFSVAVSLSSVLTYYCYPLFRCYYY